MIFMGIDSSFPSKDLLDPYLKSHSEIFSARLIRQFDDRAHSITRGEGAKLESINCLCFAVVGRGLFEVQVDLVGGLSIVQAGHRWDNDMLSTLYPNLKFTSFTRITSYKPVCANFQQFSSLSTRLSGYTSGNYFFNFTLELSRAGDTSHEAL